MFSRQFNFGIKIEKEDNETSDDVSTHRKFKNYHISEKEENVNSKPAVINDNKR